MTRRWQWVLAGAVLVTASRMAVAQDANQHLTGKLTAIYGNPKSVYSPFTCSVNFDYDHTKLNGIAITKAGSPLMSQKPFRVSMDDKGTPTTTPPTGVDTAKLSTIELLLWQVLPSLSNSSMQTWYSVGIAGPYPPKDNTVITVNGGKTFARTTNGDKVDTATFESDGKFVHLQEVEPGQQLEESPRYMPLLGMQFYSGADVQLTTASGTQDIHTDYTYDTANGWVVPKTVHITVGRTVDAVLVFSGCTGEKPPQAAPVRP